MAAEMSPSLPPGRAAAMPAARAASVAAISSASPLAGAPMLNEIAASPTQPVAAGDAVQRGVVHRSADHRRVRDGGELRVVVEDRGGRARLGEDLTRG